MKLPNIISIERRRGKYTLIPRDNIALVEVQFGDDETGMRAVVHFRQMATNAAVALTLTEAEAENFIEDFYGKL